MLVFAALSGEQKHRVRMIRKKGEKAQPLHFHANYLDHGSFSPHRATKARGEILIHQCRIHPVPSDLGERSPIVGIRPVWAFI